MTEEIPAEIPHREPPSVEREIYRVTNILKRIAAGFEYGSEDETALRDAAFAYTLVSLSPELFEKLSKLRALDGPLTAAMRDGLRLRGIDPDALEANVAAELEALADDERGDSDAARAT